MSKLSSIKNCPCCSGKLFSLCCAKRIMQGEKAKTPEQLMRSRFTAYYLGGFGDYLLDTWFPATSKGLNAIELSEVSCDWQRLDVLDKSQSGDDGFVEFNAWFIDENGNEAVLHEKSVFTRVAGRWFYVGGDVDNTAG